jgi:AAA+ ATPase superfamily predicted ATPase
MKHILSSYYPVYTNEDLLTFYLFTGGIPRYIEYIIDNKLFTRDKILDDVLREGSFFLDEGHAVLVDKLGKDYGNYYSALTLIASSTAGRGGMENMMNMPIGGYLERLEKDYGLIARIRPFGAKEGSRNNQYKIEDNFINFWFRFIYKYRSVVEIGNFSYLRNIIERDYDAYSSLILERYFREKLIESKQFSAIGSFWNRKGENQIDLIAINEMEKRLVFYEIKRNQKDISIALLEEKSKEITQKYPDFRIEYKGLSMEDM